MHSFTNVLAASSCVTSIMNAPFLLGMKKYAGDVTACVFLNFQTCPIKNGPY